MLGCFLATACSCVIGMIWYHPKLPTGSVWMRRTHPGKTVDEVAQNGKSAIGLSIIAAFFTSLLLRFILVDFFHIKAIVDAVKFTVGISCLTTLLQFPHTLFNCHSVDAFIIDQLANLLTMITSGVCIAYFM